MCQNQYFLPSTLPLKQNLCIKDMEQTFWSAYAMTFLGVESLKEIANQRKPLNIQRMQVNSTHR